MPVAQYVRHECNSSGGWPLATAWRRRACGTAGHLRHEPHHAAPDHVARKATPYRQATLGGEYPERTLTRVPVASRGIVELTGLEPVTPTLPVWCATSCAIAPVQSCPSKLHHCQLAFKAADHECQPMTLSTTSCAARWTSARCSGPRKDSA